MNDLKISANVGGQPEQLGLHIYTQIQVRQGCVQRQPVFCLLVVVAMVTACLPQQHVWPSVRPVK